MDGEPGRDVGGEVVLGQVFGRRRTRMASQKDGKNGAEAMEDGIERNGDKSMETAQRGAEDWQEEGGGPKGVDETWGGRGDKRRSLQRDHGWTGSSE
jgi:hypothetical protein